MKKLLSSVYKSAIILTIVAQSPCAMEPSNENKTKTSPFSPQKGNEKVNAPWKITNNSYSQLKPLDVLSSPIVQHGRKKIEDNSISDTISPVLTLKRKVEHSDLIAEIKKQKTDIYDYEQINETNIDSFIKHTPISNNTKNISSPFSPQKGSVKTNSGFGKPMHPKLIEFYGTSPLILEGSNKISGANKITASITSPYLPPLKAVKGNDVPSPLLINNNNYGQISPVSFSVKTKSGFSRPMHPKLKELYGISPLIAEGSLKISDVNRSPSLKISSPLPPLNTPKGSEILSLPLIHNHAQKTSNISYREDKDQCEVTHTQGRDEHLMLLRDMLESAEQNILITSHSITRIDHDIYKLLLDAVYRGVKIDIYYKKNIDERVEESFYENNIRCEQKNIHAKYLIIDRKHFIVGSYNWLDFNNGDTDRSFQISENGGYVNQLRGKTWADIIKNRYSPSKGEYDFKVLDINRSSNLMFITTLFDHEAYLLSACKEAKKRVVIYSPFVTLDNAKKRLNDISKCLNENVKLSLVIGDLYKGLSNIVKNMHLLNKRTEITFDDQFHRKTLIIDDNIISEGSFNWLSSATNTESDYHNQDSSLIIRGPLARDIINNDDDLYDSVG